MSSPFIGEIRMFGGNFAPAGWMFCEGQLLAISENDALFTLIGTTYGGDGQSTFALPDLRGRIPIHVGPGFVLAQNGGVERVTLTVQQIPAHTHAATGVSGSANGVANPANNTWGGVTAGNPYTDQAADATMNASSIGNTGGSQPHDNFMPYLCSLVDRFTRQPRDFQWQPHRHFGQMSEKEWMRLAYLHMDHHLRQFGA